MKLLFRYLFVGTLLSAMSTAQAAIVYSRIIESNLRANANNPGFFGAGDPGSQTRINFDDAPIPASILGANHLIKLNSVTVGIRRGEGAVQNNVRVWASAMNANGTVSGSPMFLGSELLPPRTESGFATDLVTISNLTQSLSTNSGFTSGYSSILIGVQLSQDSLAGWRITTGSDYNTINFANLYETATSTNSIYNMAATPFTSFYVQVDATPVPEPTILLSVVTGLLILKPKMKRSSEA